MYVNMKIVSIRVSLEYMFWIVRILTQIDPSDENANRNSNLNTKG